MNVQPSGNAMPYFARPFEFKFDFGRNCESLQFREIEFAKSVTKKKIVTELKNAIDFQDKIQIAELIAEYTLPITPSQEIVFHFPPKNNYCNCF